ncbi:MAG: hypothetical protein M1457_02560 [bacterium]|nr:hypothetical protein [bacterium]
MNVATVDSCHAGRRLKSRLAAAAVLLCLAAGLTAHAGPNDIIGGKNIVPINPDFKPSTVLYSLDASGNLILDGSGNPIDIVTNPVTSGILNSIGMSNILSFQISVPVQLGAALAQSISAGNRPSVLTPYGGILAGEGENVIFDSFGSLVTNKATTLGRGKFGIGLSYQHSKFDQFDGKPIGNLLNQSTVSVENLSGNFAGVDLVTDEPFITRTDMRVRDVEFKADVVTLSLTYGLLESLDVGALIPYIWLNTSGRAEMKIDQSVHIQPVDPTNPFFISGASSRKFRGKWDRDYDGIGDVILFTKWQIISQAGLPKRIKGPVDLALQFEVKLPTGNEDKFLGTGKTDVALRMLLQRALSDRLRVRGELGYNRSGLGNSFNTVEYKVGGEYMITVNLAGSVEVIGNYSEEYHNIIDIIGGLKYSISRDLKVFAGLRGPLNDNGLRYPYSPILGVEYTFSRGPRAEMASLQPTPAEAATPAAAPEAKPVEQPAKPAEGQFIQTAPLTVEKPAAVATPVAQPAPAVSVPAPAGPPPAASLPLPTGRPR